MTVKSYSQRPARTATRKTRTPARRNGRDGDTEARILDAAHTVFLRRGTAGARMQEIAREAGVNQALLHYYFRSKKGLASAVFRRVVARIIPPVIQVMASDAPLEEKLERVVGLYIDNLSRSPFLPGYFLAELNLEPERAGQLFESVTGLDKRDLASLVLSRLRAQIDRRVREGTMRRIEPEDFIVTVTSLCIFPFAARPMLAAVLGLDDDGFRRLIERRRRELPRFILRGFAP